MRFWIPLMLIAVGGLVSLLALLPLGLGLLGYWGMAADVGPAENQELGEQLVRFGLPVFVLGASLCGVGVVWMLGSLLSGGASGQRSSQRTGSIQASGTGAQTGGKR